MIKKHIKILITLLISLIIIISPCISKAVITSEDEGSAISTDTNEGENASNNANDETQDKEDELRIYTIEEIIFNKIPILNVNVFDTSDVKEDSIAMRIRTSIATWYVSFRNISIVCLAFVLVYIGIRMAMATVASDRANYKKMLINWVSAVLIVFFIHFIMMFVFFINDSLVDLLSKENRISDIPIYETIRTRSQDLRFSVGIPAAIMYIVLFIYSLMFLWVYIKRLFTVLILIILAPLVGVKYAIDSAGKGQRSKIFTSWVYEFTMNVLIQPVHALLYVALMQIAINLATTNVIGFIIALVFINFMLKADKIFMKIFHFDRSKMIKDIADPKKNLKEEFAGAFFMYGVGKDVAGATKKYISKGANAVKRGGRTLYREHVSEETRNDIKNQKNDILNKVDSTLNSAYHKITRGKDSYYLQLRIMSRQKGKIGNVAKRNLKKAKKELKARYTAPFKFIKQAGGGIIMIATSLPMGVVNPGVGLGMFVKGATGIRGMATQKDEKGNKYKGKEGVKQAVTLGAYGTYKQLSKGNKKVGATVSYLNQATIKENEIQRIFSERFNKVSDEAIKRYKQEVKFYIKYASQDNLNLILRQGLAGKGVIDINDTNIDLVIKDMTNDIFNKLGIEKQYSQNIANQMRDKMMKEAKSLYEAKKASVENTEFGSLDLAGAFSQAIKNEGISSEINDKFMQNSMEKVLKENKYNKIDSRNVEDFVNRYTESIIKDLNLSNRFSNTEVTNNILNEAKKYAEDLTSQNNASKFEGQDIASKVQKIVETSGKQAGIDFGFGNVTQRIEELHEINRKAQDEIKTSVVKEDKFIDSL